MPDPQPLSFGIVTDCQYADVDPEPPNYYRESAKKLRRAIESFNAHDLAFIANLGDTIDRDLGSFDAILPIFESARAPVYHLLGNHDFKVPPEDRSRVPGRLSVPGPPHYRSLSISGWRFLCLDGNEVSTAAHPPDSPEFHISHDFLQSLIASGAKNALPFNGGIGKKQLGWLDSQLGEADSAGERTVIFNHFPVLPQATHNLWDDQLVVKTLTRHPSAAAHINGHLHRGGYAEHAGVHYFTLKGMLETPDTATFAIAHLEADRLQIRGFGNQKDFDLPLNRIGGPTGH